MNYEKKYKEALERARENYHAGCLAPALLEYIFPELKESKDETQDPCIEKRTFKEGKSVFEVINEKYIKVESKFKAGDWVVVNNSEIGLISPLHIVDSGETQYSVEDVNGNSGCPKIEYIDRYYHLAMNQKLYSRLK